MFSAETGYLPLSTWTGSFLVMSEFGMFAYYTVRFGRIEPMSKQFVSFHTHDKHNTLSPLSTIFEKNVVFFVMVYDIGKPNTP